MARVLQLTSPHMEGPDVRGVQLLLQARGFYAAPVDGVFGPTTAEAVKRAKYRLGWPIPRVTAYVGPLFRGVVSGKVPRSPLMIRRAKGRVAGMRRAAYLKAVSFLGTKESPPGSNNVLFSRWYGVRGPWCAMFVSYCYDLWGAAVFQKGKRYAYVPFILGDARLGENALDIVLSPSAGDLVLYDWDGNRVPDHVGIFEKWTGPGQFTAIEGNTSLTSDSNGGEVMRRVRFRSQVAAFVRVGA